MKRFRFSTHSDNAGNSQEWKWNVGQIVWFVIFILSQWMVTINYATMAITKYSTVVQRLMWQSAVIAGGFTLLILWEAIGHSKAAARTILLIQIASVIATLLQGGGISALAGLVLPALNYGFTYGKLR